MDDAQPERTRQGIATQLGNLADAGGFIQDTLGLVDDLQTDWGHTDLDPASLKKRHPQLFFELADTD